jgi:hypothetical protein
MARYGMWPTPQAFDANECQKGAEAILRDKNRRTTGGSGGPSKNLREVVQNAGADAGRRGAAPGQLNPQFVEWLMGLPKDWTDLTK